MRNKSALLSLLLTAVLTACGGGSGGNSGSANTTPASSGSASAIPAASPSGNSTASTSTSSTGTTTTTASATTSTVAAPASARYSVSILAPLSGHDESGAYGINNQGTVVGYSVAADSLDKQPFIYQNGQMQPALGEPAMASLKATMITDKGVIAGYVYQPRAQDGGGAFVIKDGAYQRISSGGGTANGMNSDGKLVANTTQQSFNPDAQPGESPFVYTRYCFVYQDGTITNLTEAIGARYALGINLAGDVVGTMPDGAGFLYAGGKVSTLPVLPSDTQNMPLAINDSREIVGASASMAQAPLPLDPKNGGLYSDGPAWHAYAIRNGVIRQLGTQLNLTTSMAFAINNNGVALGQGYRGGQLVTFLSRRDGAEVEVSNLPELAAAGITRVAFYGLNEAGQLVGTGVVNGKLRAILLTPKP